MTQSNDEILYEKLMETNEKLDWIAYRLMRLTIAFGDGLSGTEVDEYAKLFGKVKVKEIPKE